MFDYKQLFPGSRVDVDGVYHSPNVCFATEGPTMRDGAQTTAGSDMSGVTVTTLGGYQSSGQYLAVKINASRSVCAMTSSGDMCYGILQNKPPVGAAAEIMIEGITKMMAGGTITADGPVMADASGRGIARTAGSSYTLLGYAIEAGVATQLFTMRLAITPVIT
jgi:hypothetical protein